MGLQVIDGGKNIKAKYHSKFEKLGIKMDGIFDALSKEISERNRKDTPLFILVAITTEWELDRMQHRFSNKEDIQDEEISTLSDKIEYLEHQVGILPDDMEQVARATFKSLFNLYTWFQTVVIPRHVFYNELIEYK